MKCIRCESSLTVMAGKNPSGSQRHYCKACQRHFTPVANQIGYDQETKLLALRHYIDGNNYRRTGRQIGVNHQTVVNWVKTAAEKAAAAPTPLPEVDENTIVELDELYTFIGDKKKKRSSSRKSIGKHAVL
jgi:transposase-like protein